MTQFSFKIKMFKMYNINVQVQTAIYHTLPHYYILKSISFSFMI